MEGTEQKTKPWSELLYSLRRFFNSYAFYVMQALVACLFVATRQEVAGVVTFAALIALLLVVCDDILPTTLPFLLLCTVATNCYDSFDTFVGYAIYAPVVVLALVAHFVVYRKTLKWGESVLGICAVSIAVLLGGVGNFGLTEYVRGAYYILGLGAGMIVAYALMKSEFSPRRQYDLRKKFSVIMTLMGLLCVAMVAIGYVYRWLDMAGGTQSELGFSRNNICTLLMFAMPFPLYLTKKSDWWALFSLLFFGAICVSTSRGGLLFGGVEFVVCCVYWIYIAKRKWARLTCVVLALGALALCCGSVVLEILDNRFFTDDNIVGEVRFVMILEALERFKKSPLVGSGILDNSIAYGEYKKAGTMAWYHMMIPQIVGSMGLIGICAYGFQILQRFKLIFTKKSSWSLVLGISYLGILMMSQVNPGEFCPLPFGLLTILLFILQERRLEQKNLPLLNEKK